MKHQDSLQKNQTGLHLAQATSLTPALVIYLLDASASMGKPMPGGTSRIDMLHMALRSAIKQMISRSTRGNQIQPRYLISMLAYSNEPHDLLDGVKSITEIASLGIPKLQPMTITNTAEAFQAAHSILLQEMPKLPPGSPAPLICHITDAEMSEEMENPEPIVREIQNLATQDGNVLVENIHIAESLHLTTQDAASWPGYMPDQDVGNPYGNMLLRISSVLPESYRAEINENGYSIKPGTAMMYPGSRLEFVRLAFVMSTMSFGKQ